MRSVDPLMFLQLQANQKTQQDEIENRLKEIQQEVNMNNQYLFCEILFFQAKKMSRVASMLSIPFHTMLSVTDEYRISPSSKRRSRHP